MSHQREKPRPIPGQARNDICSAGRWIGTRKTPAEAAGVFAKCGAGLLIRERAIQYYRTTTFRAANAPDRASACTM